MTTERSDPCPQRPVPRPDRSPVAGVSDSAWPKPSPTIRATTAGRRTAGCCSGATGTRRSVRSGGRHEGSGAGAHTGVARVQPAALATLRVRTVPLRSEQRSCERRSCGRRSSGLHADKAAPGQGRRGERAAPLAPAGAVTPRHALSTEAGYRGLPEGHGCAVRSRREWGVRRRCPGLPGHRASSPGTSSPGRRDRCRRSPW